MIRLATFRPMVISLSIFVVLAPFASFLIFDWPENAFVAVQQAFGGILLAIIPAIFDRRRSMKLSPHGVSLWFLKSPIPWSSIVAIGTKQRHGQNFFTLTCMPGSIAWTTSARYSLKLTRAASNEIQLPFSAFRLNPQETLDLLLHYKQESTA